MIKKRYDLLFPTPIGELDVENNILFHQAGTEVLKLMRDVDKELLDENSEWTTGDDLHLLPQFAALTKLINTEASEFFAEIIGLDINDLGMTGMWANVRRGGSRHHMHVHPNSFFSGVTYLQLPKENPGDIIFADPRPGVMFNADWKKDGPLSYRSWWYTPAVGKVLFFPSWLEHGTEGGKFDDNELRVSLSFNYILMKCNKHTMPLNLKL
jgi:uncharacterized protein (TIGR02466 family)